jgi:hypothetical protein
MLHMCRVCVCLWAEGVDSILCLARLCALLCVLLCGRGGGGQGLLCLNSGTMDVDDDPSIDYYYFG